MSELSPLLQKLTAVVARIAEMERQIDELTQTTIEQRARIENYEDRIKSLQYENASIKAAPIPAAQLFVDRYLQEVERESGGGPIKPLSKDLDRLAAGPIDVWGADPRVPRPRYGERCHRCHKKHRPERCALCNPQPESPRGYHG